MTYNQAIELLYNSLPVFQHSGPGAYKPGLDTSRKLDDLAGNPHRSYKTIHIAGTNGKGSTAHTLAAILQCAGYKTGLYTSPHIFDFRERIRVNGEMISEKAVVNFVERWVKTSHKFPSISPSFFELTSTLAFEYFAQMNVDVAVIETGLGGRLDSTNIISPILSVITNISLDHTSLLGDTLRQIATEKAGIIKAGMPVVIGESVPETESVFTETAKANNSEIIFAKPIDGEVRENCNFYPETDFGPLTGQLKGECQKRNAATVIAAVEKLRDVMPVPDSAVAEGFAKVVDLTHLFGRWTSFLYSPLTVCDTGHNQGGWELLVDEIRNQNAITKHIVMGFVADKELSHILELLSELRDKVTFWFSSPSCQRGLPAHDLMLKASDYGIEGKVEPDVNKAISQARDQAGADGFVLVAGSNFLIADIRDDLKLA